MEGSEGQSKKCLWQKKLETNSRHLFSSLLRVTVQKRTKWTGRKLTCMCSPGTRLHMDSSLLMSQHSSLSSTWVHSPVSVRCFAFSRFRSIVTWTSRPFFTCAGIWTHKAFLGQVKWDSKAFFFFTFCLFCVTDKSILFLGPTGLEILISEFCAVKKEPHGPGFGRQCLWWIATSCTCHEQLRWTTLGSLGTSAEPWKCSSLRCTAQHKPGKRQVEVPTSVALVNGDGADFACYSS